MAADGGGGGCTVVGSVFIVAVLFIQYSSCCPTECECTDNRYVVCTGTDLTEIPEGIPSNTISLSLYNNKISSITAEDFSQFDDLISLDLSSNELQSLPDDVFVNLTRLESLLMLSNSLFDIPSTALSALDSLQELSLENNPFAEIPAEAFSSLKNMEYLFLGLHYLPEDSQIDEDAFEGLEHLISLSLHNCNLTSYPMSKLLDLKSLESLDLHGNEFVSVPGDMFGDLPYLIMLDLSENKITTVDDHALRGIYDLELFYVSKNDIVVIPENLIRDAPNCAIDLSDNPLTCNCSNLWLKEGIGLLSNDAQYALETTARCTSPDDVAGLLVWEVDDSVIQSGCTSPDIVSSYGSRVSVLEDSELTIDCDSTGVPQPYIEWTTSSRIVVNEQTDSTSYSVDDSGTLTILSVGLGDGGVFACTADNHYDRARKEFQLEVVTSAGEGVVAQVVAVLVAGSVVVFIIGLIIYIIRKKIGATEMSSSSVATVSTPGNDMNGSSYSNPAFQSQTLSPVDETKSAQDTNV